jgi:arylsulfatase A-like enzyme
LILGAGEQKIHDHLYWEFHELGGRQAVLKGDWKLVKYQVKDGEKTTIELFNLKNDPSETEDLALVNPKKVKELEELVREAHRPNPVFRLFEN